ncbi:telomeric repeat-binding factor 2-interacting protein 1-like isoform X1 [Ptychodera flava]|uniref:telomeric repeat-binding factor 2-interacting protein 1-like isoform X1 n=1 Tax=Ptychodera flava TaxID=63121 RepID=UPI00396A3086
MADDDVDFSHSSTLFTADDGQPVTFYMRPCDARARIRPIVEHGGGTISSKYDRKCIKLSVEDEIRHSDDYISIKYIEDCAKENRLLPLDSYRLKKQVRSPSPVPSLSSSVISLSGRRTAYTESEDHAILSYLAKHHYEQLGGNKIWKKMELLKMTDHSWQSMRDRFRKKLKPQLDVYIKRQQKDKKEVPKSPDEKPKRNDKDDNNILDTSVEIEEFDSSCENSNDTEEDVMSNSSSFDEQLYKAAESSEAQQTEDDGKAKMSDKDVFKSPMDVMPQRLKARKGQATKKPLKTSTPVKAQKGSTRESEECDSSEEDNQGVTLRPSDSPHKVTEDSHSAGEKIGISLQDKSGKEFCRVTRQTAGKSSCGELPSKSDKERWTDSSDGSIGGSKSSKIRKIRESTQDKRKGQVRTRNEMNTEGDEVKSKRKKLMLRLRPLTPRKSNAVDRESWEIVGRESADEVDGSKQSEGSQTGQNNEDAAESEGVTVASRQSRSQKNEQNVRGTVSRKQTSERDEDAGMVARRQTRSQKCQDDETEVVSRRQTRSQKDGGDVRETVSRRQTGKKDKDDEKVARIQTRSQRGEPQEENNTIPPGEEQLNERRSKRRKITYQDEEQSIDKDSEDDQEPDAKKLKGLQFTGDEDTAIKTTNGSASLKSSHRLRDFVMEDVDKEFMESQPQSSHNGDLLASIDKDDKLNSDLHEKCDAIQAIMTDFGLSLKAAVMAIFMCSGSVRAARYYLVHGKMPSGCPAWCAKDERKLQSSDPADIRELQLKYGVTEVLRHMTFLDDVTSEEEHSESDN